MLPVVYLTSAELLGVDHWRVYGPARLAQKLGWPVAVTPLGNDLPLFDGAPPGVLVCSQRASSRPGAYAHIRERLCRKHGMLLVVDVCDDPTDADSYVGATRARVKSAEGHSVRELAQDAITAADLVTVNSEPMAAVVRNLNPNVAVIPDLIDGERWSPPHYERVDGDPRMVKPRLWVGVAGGESHDEDWRVLGTVWPRLAARHPHLGFACIGHTPRYLAESSVLKGRLIRVPWLPMTEYQRAYQGLDVGCAPLADLKFNASKSPIKHFEYALAGAATVASPLVYGRVIRDGDTGYLATSPDQWVTGIEKLLGDRSHRLRVADKARVDVLARHLLTEDRLAERHAVYAEHHGRVYGVQHSAA